jgi:hypothetical protein
MPSHSTPGPGGFGPAPAFQHAHPGVKLQPAQTHAVPGNYDGPPVGGQSLLLVVILALVAVLAAVAMATRRRR